MTPPVQTTSRAYDADRRPDPTPIHSRERTSTAAASVTQRPTAVWLSGGLDDVEATLVCRLVSTLDITLDRLHLAIQAAMSWTEIRAGMSVEHALSDADKDPKHERHDEITEWFADDFDPAIVDPNASSEKSPRFAKRWSQNPATKRARST